MNHPRPSLWFVSIGIVVLLPFALGCEARPKPDDASAPEPTPKPPTCQQKDNTREISRGMLLSPNQKHYAHFYQDDATRAIHLITDGVQVADRFEDIGPGVFHRSNQRFAFIGIKGGVTYILEYNNGSRYPNIAHRVQQAVQNKWVCYSDSGEYLVTLAQRNRQWLLLVRHGASGFCEIPLPAEPTALELLPPNWQGAEGFTYQIDLGGIAQEIRNWFKPDPSALNAPLCPTSS